MIRPPRLADSLVAQADAQDGQFARQLPYRLLQDSSALRISRTGRENQVIRFHGPDLMDGHRVVSHHPDIRPDLSQHLD